MSPAAGTTHDWRHEVWNRKEVLRLVYDDFYRRIAAACRSGSTLEIGGGSGGLASCLTDVITTDIVATSGLDLVADAQRLPFADRSFDNLVAVDVLHHIEYPRHFLSEASRILRRGGRIILVEPAVTAGSFLFYRFLHEEGFDLGADPLSTGMPRPDREPFEANQAVPTLLFGCHRARFAALFPELRLLGRTHMSLLVYLLSGGFRRWSLIPAALAGPGLRLERRLEPALGWLLGFRMLVVIERL